MATVEQTMMKVQRILTGPMGLNIMIVGGAIRIGFEKASTQLHIRVVEWGEDDDGQPRSLVLVRAPILRSVEPTPDLYEWVARKGSSAWFGRVEVHDFDDDTVHLLLSHTLLGDYLDRPELEATMWGVLRLADTWDDELQAKFGGKRFSDA